MLEGLTIIIGVIIVLGGILIATSKGDSFVLVSGMIITTFGSTALYWIAKATAPYLREEAESIRWLYKPLASLPEWVGHIGVATTAILWVASVALLVDDFAHLPRRKKGGRI